MPVTASDICACAGLSPDTRRRWVEVHDLLGAGPFTEHDAIETAVAAALIAGTTTQRARTAFAALRAQLRIEVVAGHHALWAVVPHRFDALLARTPTAVTTAAARADGPVWVVPLGNVIERARSRYATHASQRPADVRSLVVARGA